MEAVRTPDQELQRAHEAQRIMSSPIFVEAAQEIEKTLFEERRKAATPEIAMQVIRTEQLLHAFLDTFKKVMQDGELAQYDISRRESWRERFARLMRGDPREPV